MRQKIGKYKAVFIILICITLLFGISCIVEKKIRSANILKMDSIDEIKMYIKDNTLTKTGMSIIITDSTGDKNAYGGSCEYRIEIKKDNGWQKMEKKENLPSYLQSYFVDEDDRLEMDIDWTNTYGELDIGKYRLVKNIDIKNKLYEFSVEFEIL